MGWNKQINSDGDTLADWAAENLDRIATALEDIVELLKPRVIWRFPTDEDTSQVRLNIICPGCNTTTTWTMFGSDWKCSTCGEWHYWYGAGWIEEGENPFSQSSASTANEVKEDEA